jgi:hypothetical protein
LLTNFAGAVPLDKRAVFVSNAATAAMGYYAFFGWNATAVGEVGFADATVYTAWRDEVSCKLGIHNEEYGIGALMTFINSNQANEFNAAGVHPKVITSQGFPFCDQRCLNPDRNQSPNQRQNPKRKSWKPQQ